MNNSSWSRPPGLGGQLKMVGVGLAGSKASPDSGAEVQTEIITDGGGLKKTALVVGGVMAVLWLMERSRR
jgi:hypothetical protein